MKHTLSVLVENKPGVLARISGLFARRGFNIQSLAVGVTDDPKLSRVTLVIDEDDAMVEQITKQLNKLIPVFKVLDLADREHIARELALFKVSAPATRRNEIIEIVNLFRGSIVDVGKSTLIVSVTGDGEKIAAMEDLLRSYGIKETARTGEIALARGARD